MPKPLWLIADERQRRSLLADGLRLDQQAISPVPGVGIGTPWGKKPNDNTYWQARGHHTGDDYPAAEGTGAVAVRAGKTVWRHDSVLGRCVLLFADDGNTYWYCHLSARDQQGTVRAGERIGRVGQTGTGARGPHLHFEKRTGHTTSWAGPDLQPRW